MSGTFKGLTQAQIDRRLKDGVVKARDQTTSRSSTQGTCPPGSLPPPAWQQDPAFTPSSIDLELAIFLTLDRSPHVTDIRNSFRCGSKIRCASPRSLACPRLLQGYPAGTDQRLSGGFRDPQRPSIAIQAKYSTDLQKPKLSRGLSLKGATGRKKVFPGHRYGARGIQGGICQYPMALPAHAEGDIAQDDLAPLPAAVLLEFQRHPDRKLTAIAQGLVPPASWRPVRRSIGYASCWPALFPFRS